MDFKAGQVVKSAAGRDKGRLLAVIGEENGFVLVCDGKERPLGKPKMKNPKHIEKTSMFIESDSMATNPKLRKTLNKLSKKGE